MLFNISLTESDIDHPGGFQLCDEGMEVRLAVLIEAKCHGYLRQLYLSKGWNWTLIIY